MASVKLARIRERDHAEAATHGTLRGLIVLGECVDMGAQADGITALRIVARPSGSKAEPQGLTFTADAIGLYVVGCYAGDVMVRAPLELVAVPPTVDSYTPFFGAGRGVVAALINDPRARSSESLASISWSSPFPMVKNERGELEGPAFARYGAVPNTLSATDPGWALRWRREAEMLRLAWEQAREVEAAQ